MAAAVAGTASSGRWAPSHAIAPNAAKPPISGATQQIKVIATSPTIPAALGRFAHWSVAYTHSGPMRVQVASRSAMGLSDSAASFKTPSKPRRTSL
jgi:hypothetical protein